MPDIELVMEVDSCFLESLLHSLMQLKSTLDDVLSLILDTLLESREMTVKDGRVDDREGLSLWLRD